MRYINTLLSFILAIMITFFMSSCKKFLDEKSNKNYVIPATLKDLQALLDDYAFINYRLPFGGEVSADNYFLSDEALTSLTDETQRNMYLWLGERNYPLETNDWSFCYKVIYIANTVLETIEKINRTNDNSFLFDDIKGQALFLRALYYHNAALVWCAAYSGQTAETSLGLPLRLNTNFNEKSVRSTLEETYNLIIGDLNEAVKRLPVTPVHVMRPSKPAAFALLSRVHLSMGEYVNAKNNADSTLSYSATLLDYNSSDVNPSATNPFRLFNPEVMYHARMQFPSILAGSRAKIDTLLYRSYDNNDMRKNAFFRINADGSFRFKGSYDPGNFFAGLATDEVYLTRAECNIRLNNLAGGLADLNTLLKNRYQTGLFTPITTSNTTDALDIVLSERRKELLMRGIRWMDLKRLNIENANITISRNYNLNHYTLSPNDLRYALLIPEDVIQLSGMQQNPR